MKFIIEKATEVTDEELLEFPHEYHEGCECEKSMEDSIHNSRELAKSSLVVEKGI